MTDITVEELHQRMGKEPLHIIDVREQYEYDEFNLGGRLIPLGTLPAQADDLEDLRHQEVIVHCRSGARSAAAKDYLVSQGFTNVRNLLGGVMDWQMKFPV